MAFEPLYSDPVPSYPKRLAVGQAVVEARLLPAGYTVEKVLSASADVCVTPGEAFSGEARYSGRATFRALVLDGDGLTRALDYVAEFTDKLTGDGITALTQPILTCSVLDTDIVAATGGEIKLACVVEVSLIGTVSESVHCLTAGGEGIYTHEARLNYTRLTGQGRESHTVQDTIAAEDVDEILFCEPRAFIVKRAAGSDCIACEGIVINDMCVRRGDQPASLRTETPFSLELSAPDTHMTDIAEVWVAVDGCRVELVQSEASTIACDYTLTLSYRAFCEDAAAPVCDAFSVQNELQIDGRTVSLPLPLGSETIFERIEGKVTLDEASPAADKILCVTGSRLGITGATAGDGKITLEGMAGFSLVYAAEDGQKASAAVELPFSLTVSAPYKEGDNVFARGCVTGVDVKVRRTGELEIKADVAFEVSACRTEEANIIEKLTLGEARAVPDGAVAIHIARKGETLWDAAKALGTTPENVLLQNPALSLPCEGGERVFTYRCLTK